MAIGFGLGYLIFKDQVNNSHIKHSTQESELQVSAPKNETWTCSMHPQIRQDEPGLCPLCAMDLIPLDDNASGDPLVLMMTEEAIKLSNIETTVVSGESGGNLREINLSGKVRIDERRVSSQVSHVSGRIEKLYVTFKGEQVYRGQKLAEIYAPELISAQRELIEAMSLTDINPALQEAARNKLKYLKIDSSVIERIQKEGVVQETFTVFAESNGIVTQRRVSVGDYVNTGASLFEIVDLNKVWVLFDAYENELMHFKVGDIISFTTPSVAGKTFKARLTFVDPVVNPETRVVSLRTEVNNTSGKLKPEMFVRGKVTTKGSGDKDLLVPKSAVMWTGARSVVYVKLPNVDIPSFQFREIEIGPSTGNSFIVLSGLEPGEEVVTHGNFTIDAAAQLNNQSSMMNRKVRIKKEGMIQIPDFHAVTPVAFKEKVSGLLRAYIDLKDALVETDQKTSAERSSELISQLDEVDMKLLEGEAHEFWMDQEAALRGHGQKIAQLNDVEKQREQFGFVTEAMINVVTAFGQTGDTVYVQHCPMAFDNEGGDWMAFENQIRNPYFGDKMMKCGTVKKIISPD